ncbi:MAG: hypothetical protein QE570_01395 [Verrucomicrobiota bacterium]|nr:hypothetical protein [Verrucomicrobiota bacterium]
MKQLHVGRPNLGHGEHFLRRTHPRAQTRWPHDRNFPDEKNDVLKDAVRHADDNLLITSDPFSIRNGSRFMPVAEMEGLKPLLAPEFRLVGAGHQSDDFYGLQVSGFMTVCERFKLCQTNSRLLLNFCISDALISANGRPS